MPGGDAPWALAVANARGWLDYVARVPARQRPAWPPGS